MAQHEESSRSTCTRRKDEPINIDVETGLDGSDRDVLPNRRWKDKTHSSPMAMDPPFVTKSFV